MAVGHMVVYYAGLGTHLLQELNDGTDIAHSMPNALYFSTEPSGIVISISVRRDILVAISNMHKIQTFLRKHLST